MPYHIVYADEISSHIRALTARQRAIVFDEINQQLSYEPAVETRNRKSLRPKYTCLMGAARGRFAVYYDVQEAPEQQVNVAAIGIKVRNRVLIAGKLYDL